ncbi:sugar 3,4-ketoisomerase [Helicobacter kayseriensis]|uniref:sugar 3,4-ketoisomerase n=1 Tax=Helicobacter kayseriensis TaxID=2905877 RepID=UPI001E592440|nr:FdtA/QdtA family cupin domain-containing protein [Helicobacter kayseriensis]MCE3046653.1 FdtA/QdtA family cupin domain-containing protein [Helicobacter kayseriensis]MCE3048045.1 FdtA/QdtA family cupin domain-containing protein [Helicobacter kayseriensis]
MAQLIHIQTITDSRGSLSVIEKILPFEIKRVFYIYNVSSNRGGHAHHKTKLAMICLGGSCKILINSYGEKSTFTLQNPNECLLLEPHEWHLMQDFSPNATLLVLASETYDPNDYIYEEPHSND